MARSPAARLRDILEAIQDVRDFTADMDQEVFLTSPQNDRKTFRAVSAAFLIIGEAAKTLPVDLKERHEDIPWPAIAGLRNHVAHEYFRVDAAMIWATLEHGDLDALETCIQEEIARFEV
ncbi:DUF86 domain-containing protein [Roseibium sp.]